MFSNSNQNKFISTLSPIPEATSPPCLYGQLHESHSRSSKECIRRSGKRVIVTNDSVFLLQTKRHHHLLIVIFNKQVNQRNMAIDYELIDNVENHRYEIRVEGNIAKIEYIKSNNGDIYLIHTEVPAILGGKGIGSQLAEKVLTDIERQGLRLVPICPFVAGYIHKYPDWRRIVMRGVLIQ